MEKLVLVVTFLIIVRSRSQELQNWVSIDCGSLTAQPDHNGLLWEPDDGFIKTGKNAEISSNSFTVLYQLRTLRFFTDQNKNCYSLPAPTSDRYFIRAMFQYGNYDGQNRPPTFDLEFNGNKWTTVVTSLSGFVFHELMYTSSGRNISICLTQTQSKQFPFISMLEIWAMPEDTYAQMRTDIAWIKGYRYNYGGLGLILGYPEDIYNRIWFPITPRDLEPVFADFTSLLSNSINKPPIDAMARAVQASSATDSIELPFTFPEPNRNDHVHLYFTEMLEIYNDTRFFDLYVNGKLEDPIAPVYRVGGGYGINTQSVGTLNVELRPTDNSTEAPLINCIEVYSESDPLLTSETSQDDLEGLTELVNAFYELKGWSGEPCLPSDSEWQWLDCTGNNPPRVTSINLSGYSLKGPLPDFSYMDALQTLNLSNNSLTGPIPEFLGKLPSLTMLDLRHNDFSGGIPQSITENSKLKYYIDGHEKPQKSNLPLIIGLSVGLPVGLTTIIAVIVAVIYFRRRPEQATTTMESGTASQQNGSVEMSGSAAVSNVAEPAATAPNLQKPAHLNEHILQTATGEDTSGNDNPDNVNIETANSPSAPPNPDNVNPGTANHPSAPPNSDNINPGTYNRSSEPPYPDQDELFLLLRQQGSSRA